MNLTRRSLSLRLALLAVTPLTAGVVRAQGGASAWASAPTSRARLVAGGFSGGEYLAGVEISLQGKAHTYWRSPGDAGVPPSLDFSRSGNLAAHEVLFPFPERIDEGGMQAFGYRGEVVLPLRLRPVDPARPVQLDLAMNYAACEKICIPAEARLSLTLAPDAGASSHAEIIARWLKRTPRVLGPGDPPALVVRPVDGQSPAWRATLEPAAGGSQPDLFCEGPEGWYFDTRAVAGGFDITLAEKPRDARLPARVRMTWRDGAGVYERWMDLDAAPAKP